jgi:hypothetical protein
VLSLLFYVSGNGRGSRFGGDIHARLYKMFFATNVIVLLAEHFFRNSMTNN